MAPDSNPNQNPPLTVPGDTNVSPETISNCSIQEASIAEMHQTLTEKDEGKSSTKSKYSKKKMGGGLYEIRKDDIFMGYQFRKMIDRNQMNISLGKMTEQEARNEVNKLIKKTTQLQRARKVEQTVSKMKAQKREEGAIPCFRSYEDAGWFAQSLRNKLDQSAQELRNGNSDGLDLEIYVVIWTMLSTPLNLKELLKSKQKDAYVQFLHAGILTLKQDQYQKQYIVHLTNATAQGILELNQYQGLNPDQLIFQQMNALSKENRSSQIDSKIKEIWPSYQINPETFIQFFQYVANSRSIFKQEFIELFIKKQIANPEWQRNNNERTISNWWENQLMRYLLSPVGF